MPSQQRLSGHDSVLFKLLPLFVSLALLELEFYAFLSMTKDFAQINSKCKMSKFDGAKTSHISHGGM